MTEICELVTSQKGKPKLLVQGYLMVKDRERGNTYYWCCERRKSESCKGRAITTFSNEAHHLQKFVNHNHAPQATSGEIARAIACIRQQAHDTRDAPSQIIQNNTAIIPERVFPYMPSQEALRMIIKHVRLSDMPPQPQTLEEINVPAELHLTLNGELFLIKDLEVGQDRILVFTTKINMQRLSRALYWIMDGTYKTVPTVFRQLYTIHAPISANDNSQILPLVYSLMSNKSEALYIHLFQILNDYAEENDFQLRLATIITDFENAAIHASSHVFPGVTNKGCFFHLGQSGWRKIQEFGLASQYGTDEHLSLMLRHLFALAFLPPDEIPTAFDTLKTEMPPDTNNVIQWFEDYYVHGKIRRIMRNGSVSRTQPLFPPKLWSIYNSVETGVPRTQNKIEAWHRRWNTLIGRAHIGVYSIISEFQKEQQHVDFQVERILNGEPRPKQKKSTIERERRIMSVVNDQPNRTTMDFLKGIASNLSL